MNYIDKYRELQKEEEKDFIVEFVMPALLEVKVAEFDNWKPWRGGSPKPSGNGGKTSLFKHLEPFLKPLGLKKITTWIKEKSKKKSEEPGANEPEPEADRIVSLRTPAANPATPAANPATPAANPGATRGIRTFRELRSAPVQQIRNNKSEEPEPEAPEANGPEPEANGATAPVLGQAEEYDQQIQNDCQLQIESSASELQQQIQLLQQQQIQLLEHLHGIQEQREAFERFGNSDQLRIEFDPASDLQRQIQQLQRQIRELEHHHVIQEQREAVEQFDILKQIKRSEAEEREQIRLLKEENSFEQLQFPSAPAPPLDDEPDDLTEEELEQIRLLEEEQIMREQQRLDDEPDDLTEEELEQIRLLEEERIMREQQRLLDRYKPRKTRNYARN